MYLAVQPGALSYRCDVWMYLELAEITERSTMYAACTGAMSTKADCMLCLCSLLMLICFISPRNRALSNRWLGACLLTAGQQSVHPTGTPHTYSELTVLIHNDTYADRSELCLRVLVLAYWSGAEYISALFTKCFLGKLKSQLCNRYLRSPSSQQEMNQKKGKRRLGEAQIFVFLQWTKPCRERGGGEGGRSQTKAVWTMIHSGFWAVLSLSQTRQSVFSGESNTAAVWEYIITALLFREDGAVLLKQRVFWVSGEGRW